MPLNRVHAKVIQVIEVNTIIGKGLHEDDPARQLIQYFSLDGKLLAEYDAYTNDKK